MCSGVMLCVMLECRCDVGVCVGVLVSVCGVCEWWWCWCVCWGVWVCVGCCVIW